MEDALLRNVATIQNATGRLFNDHNLLAKAMQSAHTDGDTGEHWEGNRTAAPFATVYLEQCIYMRSAVKNSHEWLHAHNVYDRFKRKADLIHVGTVSGIKSCIAHSVRQPTPTPRVITFAMRALICAVYEDAQRDQDATFDAQDHIRGLDAVCNALDNLARFLPERAETPETPQTPNTLQISNTDSSLSPDAPSSPSNNTTTGVPGTPPGNSPSSDTTTIATLSPQSSGSHTNANSIAETSRRESNSTDDTEMTDAPAPQEAEASRPESQQQCRYISNGNLKAITKLEAYLRQQQQAASNANMMQVQSRLFRGFFETFSAPPGSFRDPDIMFKFYISPMSSHTANCVKQALMSINTPKRFSTDPANITEFLDQFHYKAIKQSDDRSASEVIRLRYHLYNFYLETREDEEQTDFDGGFINRTSTSYLANSTGESGSPINRKRSQLDSRLFERLEPHHASKSEPEQRRLKSQIKKWQRLGMRLYMLVQMAGSLGILCLLPFPATMATQPHYLTLGCESLRTLKDDEFRALIKAWTSNAPVIWRFCAAAEPILNVLVNGPTAQHEVHFRMEYIDEADILGLVHGSEDLFAQFSRV